MYESNSFFLHQPPPGVLALAFSLGRQQIAGTQNAINELFKNAHDAYGKHVRIDFFEDEGTLVIRDDGVGMTREDFEEKWLVLGTESKAAENRGLQFRPKGAKLRQITGEKGIGRLAIALLGRQVLVLNVDGKTKTVTAFRVKEAFKYGGTKRTIEWLGQLKPLHAHRIAHEITESLSRIGVSEAEWLRLLCDRGR
jgi:hypothetical protein